MCSAEGDVVRQDMVESYVRDLLEHMTGSRPAPDGDGDLPVVFAGAKFFVRVVGRSDPYVQVFSVAVCDVGLHPDLALAINGINARMRFARAFHVEDQILIESEIWGSDINPANFNHACSNVASATDAFGPALVEDFGGRPAFQESKTDDYSAGPLGGQMAGPYLQAFSRAWTIHQPSGRPG